MTDDIKEKLKKKRNRGRIKISTIFLLIIFFVAVIFASQFFVGRLKGGDDFNMDDFNQRVKVVNVGIGDQTSAGDSGAINQQNLMKVKNQALSALKVLATDGHYGFWPLGKIELSEKRGNPFVKKQ